MNIPSNHSGALTRSLSTIFLASALVFAGSPGQLSAQTAQVQTTLTQSSHVTGSGDTLDLNRTQTQGAGPLSDAATNVPDVTGTTLANFGYLHTTEGTVDAIGYIGGASLFNGTSRSDAYFFETLTITSPTHPNGTTGSFFANWAVTGDIAESVNSTGSGRATVGWSLELRPVLDGGTAGGEGLDSSAGGSQDHAVNFSSNQHVTDFTFGQPFTLAGHLSVTGGSSIFAGGFFGTTNADVTFQWLGSTILDSNSQPVNDATYNSVSGTDYTLPASAPEPATWVTLAGGLAMLALRRRRGS